MVKINNIYKERFLNKSYKLRHYKYFEHNRSTDFSHYLYYYNLDNISFTFINKDYLDKIYYIETLNYNNGERIYEIFTTMFFNQIHIN